MPPQRKGRAALVWAGFAVSLVFAWLAVRDVDFDAFWRALRGTEYAWLVPSLAVLAVAVVLRAVRWALLFSPETRPPVRAVLAALLVGYLFNTILPVRAGEVIRVLSLHQQAGTSRVESLATAVSERVYDLLSLLALLFVALPFLPEVTWLRGAAVLAIVVVAGFVGSVVLLARHGAAPALAVVRPLARLARVSPERADRSVERFVHGLAAFRHVRMGVTGFVLTTVSWLALASSFWILMQGFGFELPYGAGLLVVIATNLAMVLPSSPAAIGVFEAATQVALSAYGVDESHGLSYALVLHAMNAVPIVVIGYAVLHRQVAAVRRARPAPTS